MSDFKFERTENHNFAIKTHTSQQVEFFHSLILFSFVRTCIYFHFDAKRSAPLIRVQCRCNLYQTFGYHGVLGLGNPLHFLIIPPPCTPCQIRIPFDDSRPVVSPSHLLQFFFFRKEQIDQLCQVVDKMGVHSAKVTLKNISLKAFLPPANEVAGR